MTTSAPSDAMESAIQSDYDEVPADYDVKYVWLDGELQDASKPKLSLMTYTLHYGLGVFEGVRAYDGANGPGVLFAEEHIDRLFQSAELVRMKIPHTRDELLSACTEVMAANGLRAGYLRPVAFVDDGKRGLSAMKNRVRVAIVVWPWGAYLGEARMKRGISPQISAWARMSARSFIPKGNICGQYVNSVLAKRDAVLSGFDEAILLDDDGYVAEASGENVFIVDKGTLVTAPTSAPILAGITRKAVIEIAKDLGYPVVEERFTRERLYRADEAFMTGTAAEVTPVRAVDNRDIGEGERGPITEKLQSHYLRAARGEEPKYATWRLPYDVPLA